MVENDGAKIPRQDGVAWSANLGAKAFKHYIAVCGNAYAVAFKKLLLDLTPPETKSAAV